MIKTESYVQEAAVGMVYRLIPVTEEIIRCVIGKEEIREPESLIIEKKDYPEVAFEAEEKEGRLNVRTKKVLVSLNLSEDVWNGSMRMAANGAPRIRRI